MLSNWYLTSLLILEITATGAAFSFLIRRRDPRWPSLLSALAVEFFTDTTLLALLNRPRFYQAYFTVYWLSIAAQAILRLWIVADIVRSFPGLNFLPSWIYWFTGCVTGFLSVACGWVTYRQTPQMQFHGLVDFLKLAHRFAVLIDQSVNVGWLVGIACFLLAVKLKGIGWDEIGGRIAAGVAVRIMSATIISDLLLRSHALTLLANSSDSICTIAVLSLWSNVFATAPLVPSYERIKDRTAVAESLRFLRAIAANRET